MLDFSHGSALAPGTHIPSSEVSTLVVAAIDAGLERLAAEEPSRTYLGASSIGDPCMRRLFYRSTRAPGGSVNPRMRRIWLRGHAAEARIVEWLRQAGFVVIDRDADGKQVRFSQVQGRFAGSVDGVLVNGPVALPYPLLLEIKCLKSSSWNDLVKRGLQAYSTTYWWQLHVYLSYLNLRHCLYVVENADTMDLCVRLIPLDMASAQAATDRAVQLISMIDAAETPPRVAMTPDHWLCRNCEFSDHCWKHV